MKRILIFLLLTAAFLVGVTWALVTKSHWLPRTGLPDFDLQKAAQLDPARRKAYEQELFSELWQWNQGSRAYPALEDIARREKRWLEMAGDGFELAHVVLRVLQPEGGRVYALFGPLNRLEALAKSGDVGAMCLIPSLVSVAAVAHNPEPYLPLARRWLVNGAEAGHPQCLVELGRSTVFGVKGFDQNIAKGLELEFAARAAGYIHDVGPLVMHFKSKGYADLDDAKRRYCWAQIDELTWLRNLPELVLWDMEQAAKRTGRTDIALLAAELKNNRFTLQDCLLLGKGN